MKFHEFKLDNGLQVVAELNPNVHSVAMGFFVRTGSRDETSAVSGVSHFLEHMAFKGDDKFTADDVNRIFDEIGAKYNASTSEEITLFYAAVLPEYLPRACEILAAILFPSLRQEDFDMEKNVILEEIGMYEDQPSFVAYENLMRTHFSGHPLSQCILGTSQSVTDLTSEQMRNYHSEHYGTGNITLAGNSVIGTTTVEENTANRVVLIANTFGALEVEDNDPAAEVFGSNVIVGLPAGEDDDGDGHDDDDDDDDDD